jgi:hypothetical protein
MSRFDAELARMKVVAADFEKVKAFAAQYNQSSTQELRALLTKIEKYQSKLNEDAQTAKDRIGYVLSLERGLEPWEKLLDKVKKMKDTDDFSHYENQSSGALKGKLDHGKPLKPQVIHKIEEFCNSEMERAKKIISDQSAAVDKWMKHQVKHKAAVEAVKKINDSLD